MEYSAFLPAIVLDGVNYHFNLLMVALTIITSNLVLEILLNPLTCTRLATPAFKKL